jgi:hypothetical protein
MTRGNLTQLTLMLCLIMCILSTLADGFTALKEMVVYKVGVQPPTIGRGTYWVATKCQTSYMFQNTM